MTDDERAAMYDSVSLWCAFAISLLSNLDRMFNQIIFTDKDHRQLLARRSRSRTLGLENFDESIEDC